MSGVRMMKSEKDLYQDALILMWLLIQKREREQNEGTVIKLCKCENQMSE